MYNDVIDVLLSSVLWCCWLGNGRDIRSIKTIASKPLGI